MDFRSLTYKQKNYLLAAGSVIFLVFAWFFTLGDTFDRWMEFNNLKAEIKRAENAPRTIRSLHLELDEIEGKIGAFMGGEHYTRDALLDLVTSFCKDNDLTLKEYPSPRFETDNSFRIENNTIVSEGSFNNLLKLAYALEHEYKIGRVASLQFNSLRNKKTKRLALNATILLQNFKKDSDENI